MTEDNGYVVSVHKWLDNGFDGIAKTRKVEPDPHLFEEVGGG